MTRPSPYASAADEERGFVVRIREYCRLLGTRFVRVSTLYIYLSVRYTSSSSHVSHFTVTVTSHPGRTSCHCQCQIM